MGEMHPISRIIYLIGMISSVTSLDHVKEWRGNTNFHNPNNWSPAHIPCSASRVIFPASNQKLVVMMSPVSTTIREMVLPSNGEIVFPSTGALILESVPSRRRNCIREDVTFVGKKLNSWLDPNSWATKDFDSKDVRTSAVPHAEQIPCSHDKVMFPPGSSFRLLLPEVNVAIGSLNIQGQSLTTDSWRELAVSEVGRQQFIGDPSTIAVLSPDGNDHKCTNPVGCYCGTYGPKTMEAICSHAGGSLCDVALCLRPIHPVGHCCDICGASILVEFVPSIFSIAALESHVNRFTSSSVQGHVAKISSLENRIQIVYVDTDVYDGKSVEAADRLLKVIDNDMSLGLSNIMYSASGEAIDLSELSIAKSPGKIFGFIFGVFALLTIAVLLFLAYKDQRYVGGEAPSFVFSRFENLSGMRQGPVIRVWGDEVGEEAQEGKMGQKDGSSDITMEPVLPSSMPQAFDNPMYDKPGVSDTMKGPKSLMASAIGRGKKKKTGAGTSVTLENPVYSALKETVEEGEKTKAPEKEEWKLPIPPPIIKRKAKAIAAKKGKVKKEILSEEDTDSSSDSDTMTIIEDLDP